MAGRGGVGGGGMGGGLGVPRGGDPRLGMSGGPAGVRTMGGGPSPEFNPMPPTMEPPQPATPGQGAGQWVDAGFGSGPLNAQGLQWQAAPSAPSSPAQPPAMQPPAAQPPVIGGVMPRSMPGGQPPAFGGGATRQGGATRGMSPAANAESAILKRANMSPMMGPATPQMPAAQQPAPKPQMGQPGRMAPQRRPAPVPRVEPKPGM